MRKILVAALVGVALSVSGCGGSDEPTPVETVFVQPEGGSNGDSQVAIAEAEFLHDIGMYSTPQLEAQPDADLVELGLTICRALAEGNSPEEILNIAGQGGLSRDNLGTVMASATVNFCPKYLP